MAESFLYSHSLNIYIYFSEKHIMIKIIKRMAHYSAYRLTHKDHISGEI